jgi:uncharacterized protein
VTAAPSVFLDANVLFSAALGGSTFTSILELEEAGAVRLVSTRACVAEAVTNLERKRQGSIGALAAVLLHVHLDDPDLTGSLERAETLVGSDDAHVLAAALAMQAAVLVTGDVKDFGHLMERTDLPLRVRTPRAFFLEHPA